MIFSGYQSGQSEFVQRRHSPARKLRWLNYEVVGKLILDRVTRIFKLRTVTLVTVTPQFPNRQKGKPNLVLSS
jgi:hypothetical protein